METKIGFDIHGVLSIGTKRVEPILLKLHEQNYKICVVSGAPVIYQYRELSEKFKYDMSYFDEFYSIADYLTLRGCKTWRDWKDTWWASDPDWYGSKAEICRKYNITLLIDNENKYFKYFNSNEKYILLDHESKIRNLYSNIIKTLTTEKPKILNWR